MGKMNSEELLVNEKSKSIMDYDKYPVYGYSWYEISGFTDDHNKIVCPDLGLEIRGSNRNPTVDHTKLNWERLFEIYKKLKYKQPKDVIQLDGLKNGFEGSAYIPDDYDPLKRPNSFGTIICHKLEKIDNEKEAARLIRLMLKKPNILEQVIYSNRILIRNRDPYKLYLGNPWDLLRGICSGEPVGIRYLV